MSPVAPPILDDGRVQLLPPAVEMAPDLFAYGSDPRFHAYIGSQPFQDLGETRRFAERLVADVAAGLRCYWAIRELASGRVVGTLGFNLLFPPEQKVADFGYGLAPECWGTGLFTAAARLALGFGFNILGLERVQVMTVADNAGSVKGVERLGFIREGTLRQFYALAGGRRDCAVFGLLRRDWERAP